MLPQLMIEILENVLNHSPDIEELRKKEPPVNGFLFEAEFFKSLEVNSCCCVKNNNRPSCLKFSVVHVERLMPDIKQLQTGVLYELRSHHPTIDAVGLLNSDKNDSWLVFIQISVSKYEDHKSKMSSIFDVSNSMELRDSPQRTLYTYYRSLAGITKMMLIKLFHQNM